MQPDDPRAPSGRLNNPLDLPQILGCIASSLDSGGLRAFRALGTLAPRRTLEAPPAGMPAPGRRSADGRGFIGSLARRAANEAVTSVKVGRQRRTCMIGFSSMHGFQLHPSFVHAAVPLYLDPLKLLVEITKKEVRQCFS